MPEKQFCLRTDQIVELLPLDLGWCIASDRITVDGETVGYMYRDGPDAEGGSGWNFFAGDESPEYVDNPDNFAVYSVNTICNYDRKIIPIVLEGPSRSAFVRQSNDEFVEVDYEGPE